MKTHQYNPSSAQWGPFWLCVIDDRYLLFEGRKLIFSSECWEIVQRNLIEWYHSYKEEQKDKPIKKSCPGLNTPGGAYSTE